MQTQICSQYCCQKSPCDWGKYLPVFSHFEPKVGTRQGLDRKPNSCTKQLNKDGDLNWQTGTQTDITKYSTDAHYHRCEEFCSKKKSNSGSTWIDLWPIDWKMDNLTTKSTIDTKYVWPGQLAPTLSQPIWQIQLIGNIILFFWMVQNHLSWS